jgi:hypothetical protein
MLSLFIRRIRSLLYTFPSISYNYSNIYFILSVTSTLRLHFIYSSQYASLIFLAASRLIYSKSIALSANSINCSGYPMSCLTYYKGGSEEGIFKFLVRWLPLRNSSITSCSFLTELKGNYCCRCPGNSHERGALLTLANRCPF